MAIYLTIVDISVSFFVLLALGSVVGVVSGVFNVGGGFLMTPLLIFLGIDRRLRRRPEDLCLGHPL